MVDTVRTSAEMLALFADNINGDISAQDLRDLVASVVVPHGGYSVTTPAATVIAVAGTYVKAAGTTAELGTPVGMTMTADNRLTYNESVNKHFNVRVSASITSDTNNHILGIKIAKNGFLIDESETHGFVVSASKPIPFSCMADVHLTNGDYVEVFVTDIDGAASVTASKLTMVADGAFNG